MINRLFKDIHRARRAIITIYAVGVVGLTLPWTRELFQWLTPLTLVFTAWMLFSYQRPSFGVKGWIVLAAIFVAGMLAEIIGVETGWVFGTYHYGAGLGPKLMGTPWVIGINWAFLAYATSVVVYPLRIHVAGKIFLASVAMVLYDVVLEQVAPYIDMWYWKGGVVPLQNYAAWFVLSLLFTGFLLLSGIKPKNSMAATLLLTQCAFFVMLWITFNLFV